ncbi:MAG: hypothetical protein LC722_00705 [Actinobacteria bacterium]|nr:hypothetical protein [Actinomycetota bacterium]
MDEGFGLGLLLSAFLFGFRHGIDWDHIAAITDITSSQDERSKSFEFGTLYALGHALVVFVLGVLAITIGEKLPQSVDKVMGRVVGVTLILLGVYVFVSLIRHGRDFRLRSRWMLVFAGVRRAARWSRRTAERVTAGPPPASDAPSEEPQSFHHGHHGQFGHHHHERPEDDQMFRNYGRGTAVLVGMLHGVGAETPTQLVIFVAAAGAGGGGLGILVLLCFILGLLTSNSLITIGSAMGFLGASRNFTVYATVAVVTAVFSLIVGTLFVLGKDTVLPAFFGG